MYNIAHLYCNDSSLRIYTHTKVQWQAMHTWAFSGDGLDLIHLLTPLSHSKIFNTMHKCKITSCEITTKLCVSLEKAPSEIYSIMKLWVVQE